VNTEKGLKTLAQTILTKAGMKVGGEALAKHLGVSDEDLVHWLEGKSLPPVSVILKAIDLIAP